MASTPTVTAPAAAAPSSAPASAPSSSSTPTPVTAPVTAPGGGAPPVVPATPAAVETPTTTEAPAAVAPKIKGPEPKQSDYPGRVDEFLDAHHKWDQEEGEAPPEVEAPAAETTEPAKEGTKEPAAEAEPAEMAEPVTVTPEVVNEWMKKDPALKAAIEANPEVKNQMFKLARTNARAAPILEILPTVEAAQFAADESNKSVTMRSAFKHSIDNPETFPQAFDLFSHEFMIVDDKGAPILDGNKNPTFSKDYDLMMSHIINTDLDQEITRATARVKETDDENDNVYLEALKFVKEEKAKRAKGPQAPDPETLTPAQLAWQKRMEADLAARGEKLDSATKTQTAAEKKAERDTYTTNVNRKIGSAIGKRLDQFVSEKAAENVFLPSYVTDVKDPVTGQSSFGMQVYDDFMRATVGVVDPKTGVRQGGVAFIRQHLEMLESLPPSADAEKQRVDYTLQLIDDHMPGIMDKHLRQIQRREIADRAKRSGSFEKRKEVAPPEPAGGNAVQPKTFTEESAMAQARATIEKKFPDADRLERVEKTLIEKNRLMHGR